MKQKKLTTSKRRIPVTLILYHGHQPNGTQVHRLTTYQGLRRVMADYTGGICWVTPLFRSKEDAEAFGLWERNPGEWYGPDKHPIPVGIDHGPTAYKQAHMINWAPPEDWMNPS